jgi:hypothetical protein
LSFVDLAISIVGVYVAVLGLKASNENCIRTAQRYLVGTFLTAIAWLVYNYIASLNVDGAIAATFNDNDDGYESHNKNDDGFDIRKDDNISGIINNNNYYLFHPGLASHDPSSLESYNTLFCKNTEGEIPKI